MKLAQLLFTQGFGTRRACHALAVSGRVTVGGQVVDDADANLDEQGLVFEVDGAAWSYRQHALVMLNKPVGYECSLKPKHHPSVLSLLPAPLRTRGVQPIGRLDVDTTGLLLLTDDGTLLHRMTSPKHHMAKVYEVSARHAVDDAHLAQLLAGVVLDDDPRPVQALRCTRTAANAFQMTIEQGKYHQVKRMVAAVSNRVEKLHRSAFGEWTLPKDLAEGAWCWAELPQGTTSTGKS